MKVALVHDWLNQMGGAEHVLAVFKELFPGAPVYTSFYDRNAMPPSMAHWTIHTSFMERLPGIRQYHRLYLPIYPIAFEQFDFSEYDLVISNKSGFCHGVITPPHTLHICYCLTPTRFLWSADHYLARERVGGAFRRPLKVMLSALRLWDQVAAQRPDHFVSISRAVQRRVAKFYRRDSTVIHPPVNTRRFSTGAPAGRGEYDLIVSRLIPYKRIDLAVRAYTQLKRPLVIIGDGRDRPILESLAGPTVHFVGRVSDEELPRWVQGCRAFVFPGEEDFGIAPVEAQAAGRPVIAYAAGGALDTVVEGVTGVFFHEPTSEALAEAVERTETMDFDPQVIQAHARRFDVEHFKERFRRFVDEMMKTRPALKEGAGA